MSKSKNTQDTSNGQNSSEQETNSNSNSNKKELLQKIEIPGTPFWAVGNEEEGYHLMMGRYRLTPVPAKTVDELKQYLDENTYYILLQMIVAITEKTTHQIEELKEIHQKQQASIFDQLKDLENTVQK